MVCRINVFLAFVIVCSFANAVLARPKEIVDPAEAKADPDFSVQGEYVGTGDLPGEIRYCGAVGAQVVAMGGGEFRVVVTHGGLPGAGWKRGDRQVALSAKREGDATKLTGKGLSGTIVGKQMMITDAAGQHEIRLERTERKSPTLGAKPPRGAIVLFDGSNADNFDHGTISKEKSLRAGVTTKPKFDGSYRVHLEFRLSWMPTARGQARSNSGVYLHDCYEVQVLDSFGLAGRHNECGGLYTIRAPSVNMCLPPMQWQTYDIDFTAPKYEGKEKVANAHMTVGHNGVVIHDLELPGATAGRDVEGPGPRPLHLQGHGNKVQYRNIWIQKK